MSLSARRATAKTYQTMNHFRVSIHALLAESDVAVSKIELILLSGCLGIGWADWS
jgi:hypothetical protein